MIIQKELSLLERVQASLDTIRPHLAEDGGDIEVVGITSEKVVEVRLLGACETCPMSAMTMKAGVESAVRNACPEITAVLAVNVGH